MSLSIKKKDTEHQVPFHIQYLSMKTAFFTWMNYALCFVTALQVFPCNRSAFPCWDLPPPLDLTPFTYLKGHSRCKSILECNVFTLFEPPYIPAHAEERYDKWKSFKKFKAFKNASLMNSLCLKGKNEYKKGSTSC